MLEQLSDTAATPSHRTPGVKALILGTLYAAAVFFAVAFSPNMGFISHQNAAPGRVAMLELGSR